jgi:hypothetical protein
VYSDVSAIVTGTGLTGGNIEFWPYSYNTNNAASVPGASSTIFDFGDQISGSGSYGSMQIANHDAGQMLISVNGWSGNNANIDLGLGDNLLYCRDASAFINSFTTIYPDWTFRANAGGYNVKRLQVYAAISNSIPEAVFGPEAPSINVTGGLVTVSFTGIAGYVYSVQRSTNLSNWTTVLTTNAPLQFIEGNSSEPAAFYRVQYNP